MPEDMERFTRSRSGPPGPEAVGDALMGQMRGGLERRGMRVEMQSPIGGGGTGEKLPMMTMMMPDLYEAMEGKDEKLIVEKVRHYAGVLEWMADGGEPNKDSYYEWKALKAAELVLSEEGKRGEVLGELGVVESVSGVFAKWTESRGKLPSMVVEQYYYPKMVEYGEYYKYPGVDVGVRAYMRAGEIIRNVTIDNGAKLENVHATSMYAEAQLEGGSASALRGAVTNEILLTLALKQRALSENLQDEAAVGTAIANVYRWNSADVHNDSDLNLILTGAARPEGEGGRVWLKLDERALRIGKEMQVLVDTYVSPDAREKLGMEARIAEMKARKLEMVWGEFASYNPRLVGETDELAEIMHLGYWMRSRFGIKGAGPLPTNGLLFGWEKTKANPPSDPIVNTGFYGKGDAAGPMTIFARDDSGRTLRELIQTGQEIDWSRFNAATMRSWTTLLRLMRGLPEDAGYLDSRFIKIDPAKQPLANVATEKWMEDVGNYTYLLLALMPVTSTLKNLLDRDTREQKMVNKDAQESTRYRLDIDGRIWDVQGKKYLDKDMRTWTSGFVREDRLKTYDQIVQAFRMVAFAAVVAAGSFSDLKDNPTRYKKKGIQDAARALTDPKQRESIGVKGAFVDVQQGRRGGGVFWDDVKNWGVEG